MIIKEIKNRRSVRSYKPDPIPRKEILEVIKAAQFAPTGMNTKAWEFYIINNKEIKEKISTLLGQPFLKEAPVLIIPVIDPKKSITPTQDLSLAAQNIFLQATSFGLGTVWKNIRYESDVETIRELLSIPEHFMIINAIPIGYPKTKSKPHTDSDFDPKKIHQIV